MKKILPLLITALFFTSYPAFAQQETGSLELNLKLPEYTLEPTPITKYKTLLAKYLFLTNVSVTPSADSAIFGVKMKTAKGTKPSAIIVEYGKESISEHKISSVDGVTKKTPGGGLIAGDLLPGTEYRFRISAYTIGDYQEGNNIVLSPEYRFTTSLAGAGQKISFSTKSPRITLKSFAAGNTTAKLTMQSDVLTNAYIEYTEFKPYFMYTEKKESSATAKSHVITLRQLKSNTVYPYKIGVRSSEGAESLFEFILKTK